MLKNIVIFQIKILILILSFGFLSTTLLAADSNSEKFRNLLNDKSFKKQKDCERSILELLNDPNIDPNLIDIEGVSALHYAAHYGYENIVRALIRKNANVDLKTFKYHYTPLHYAAMKGRKNIISILVIEGHANINELAVGGYPPLFYAGDRSTANRISILGGQSGSYHMHYPKYEDPSRYKLDRRMAAFLYDDAPFAGIQYLIHNPLFANEVDEVQDHIYSLIRRHYLAAWKIPMPRDLFFTIYRLMLFDSSWEF